MKSIFGKLSILCFVAVIVGLVISYRSFVILDDDPMGMALMMLYLLILFVPLGFLFCVLSVCKREVPKYYRYIGFFLNCLWFLMFLYAALGGGL